MGLLVLKRTGDKIDVVLSCLVVVITLALTGLFFTSYDNQLVCVPTSCQYRPLNTDCARDWTYPTSRYQEQFLTYPDTNLHYLLLVISSLFLILLATPIFYGSPACTELFTSFSSIWKLRSNDPAVQETEWKRMMQLVLGQLKSSTTLTQHYSLYQGLGLVLDTTSFIITSLYCLHYYEVDLPGSYFRLTETGDDNFVCHQPARTLLLWFSLTTSLILALKTFNRVLCVGFTLGLPGLFGRNMLVYGDEIVDRNHEKLFNIESSFLMILTHVVSSIVKSVLVQPVINIAAFLRFYSRTLTDSKEVDIAGHEVLDVVEPLEHQVEHNGTNGFATMVEDKKTRQHDHPHNWSDLFFVLDVLSVSVDPCDMIIFLAKTDDIVAQLENEKKVDQPNSRLDVATGTLTIMFTSGGVVEKLLGMELSTSGGLQVTGWLEGPTGRLEPIITDNTLTFPKIAMGSTYQLVSAVFGRGRLLARLANFSLSLPQELKARQKKKYGMTVPLSAITQTEGRPLSLNFDIGR